MKRFLSDYDSIPEPKVRLPDNYNDATKPILIKKPVKPN
jgi:hypothetical protein